jgi:hypothetical protein
VNPAEVIERLRAAGIGALLTGSTAMNYYAEPRGTADMDLLLDMDPAAYEAQIRPLFEPEWYVAALVQSGRDHLGQISSGLTRFDLVIRRDAWTAERFRRGTAVDDPALGRVQITTAEDLVLAKLESFRASGYDLHWSDVRNIGRHVELDWAYIERWAAALGVADLIHRLRTAAQP